MLPFILCMNNPFPCRGEDFLVSHPKRKFPVSMEYLAGFALGGTIMGKEIERKYLINKALWQAPEKRLEIRQGYLSTVKERTVRVRRKGSKSFLTIKGANHGISRAEFEYEIPNEDALYMLENLCEKPLVEKIRYIVKFKGYVWEVDEFFGANAGLIMAECELQDANEMPEKPCWCGKEVSGDQRYYNSNLIVHPYSEWKK